MTKPADKVSVVFGSHWPLGFPYWARKPGYVPSVPIYPGQITGSSGSPTRWWSDLSSGPASEYNSSQIFKYMISQLSDADLQAVATALDKAVLQDGLDDALWRAEIAVALEILKREKKSGDDKDDSEDDSGK